MILSNHELRLTNSKKMFSQADSEQLQFPSPQPSRAALSSINVASAFHNHVVSNKLLQPRNASHRLEPESSVNNQDGQFRVENRRAKPKIVKNVQDQGNIFFSQQANIANSSQKRHRRDVSSQGFNNYKHFESTNKEPTGDPANFTFFKERAN